MSNHHTVELNYRHQVTTARRGIHMALADCITPVVSTKFSENSAVFLHLITQIEPDIPVIWVDTGYNTRATLAYSKTLRDKLNLNLHTFYPLEHTIIMPPELDDPGHAAFAQEVKVEPFQRALSSLKADVWLSSIRRYQTPHRQEQSIYQTLSSGLIKASPLLDWSAQTVTRYSQEHDLPLGPECFDPTKGEPFRECGLHLDQTATA